MDYMNVMMNNEQRLDQVCRHYTKNVYKHACSCTLSYVKTEDGSGVAM
jgi:hypothetical protein